MDIHDFIKQRKYLVWDVGDYDALDDASIVEATLNYGTWDDIQELIRIMGIKQVAEVFRAHAHQRRSNYYPKVANYFDLYFSKYA